MVDEVWPQNEMQIKRARFPSAVLESGIVMILGDGRWRRYGWGERDAREERGAGNDVESGKVGRGISG